MGGEERGEVEGEKEEERRNSRRGKMRKGEMVGEKRGEEEKWKERRKGEIGGEERGEMGGEKEEKRRNGRSTVQKGDLSNFSSVLNLAGDKDPGGIRESIADSWAILPQTLIEPGSISWTESLISPRDSESQASSETRTILKTSPKTVFIIADDR
ncbi:hypothetical protein ANN_04479 [Periplaneta americana]|uniref:Uncharacterized protein n=1 Tax=Periplaneta americana TaxID=6978 RepID=A0ABQ8T8N5_PERAM|nr:hypothetical protein ANN_04479 [Periplaneta americana]